MPLSEIVKIPGHKKEVFEFLGVKEIVQQAISKRKKKKKEK
jgi:hypothetical protein